MRAPRGSNACGATYAYGCGTARVGAKKKTGGLRWMRGRPPGLHVVTSLVVWGLLVLHLAPQAAVPCSAVVAVAELDAVALGVVVARGVVAAGGNHAFGVEVDDFYGGLDILFHDVDDVLALGNVIILRALSCHSRCRCLRAGRRWWCPCGRR